MPRKGWKKNPNKYAVSGGNPWYIVDTEDSGWEWDSTGRWVFKHLPTLYETKKEADEAARALNGLKTKKEKKSKAKN
jgi:hypothetical protein